MAITCRTCGEETRAWWMGQCPRCIGVERSTLTAQLASAKEERDVLGQAIGEAAVKAGIANGVPMTGPELLLMLDGVVSSLAAAKEEITHIKQLRRVDQRARDEQQAKAEAAESLLSAERKETERLQGYESVVKHNAEYQKGYDEGRRLERIEAERLAWLDIQSKNHGLSANVKAYPEETKEITDAALAELRASLSVCNPLAQSLVMRLNRVEGERDELAGKLDEEATAHLKTWQTAMDLLLNAGSCTKHTDVGAKSFSDFCETVRGKCLLCEIEHITALRERVKRMEEALREIMSSNEEAGHPCDPPRYGYFGTVAQAALKEE